MDFTLTELKILTSAIITEIIRIEDKKPLSENDKERLKTLYNLGDKIDEEKIRKHRILDEEMLSDSGLDYFMD